MIKEETLTVTIKQFTSKDGTVYTAEGPGLHQENYARRLCEHRNEMYDFLHFKVDNKKLLNYNKKNWLHFKWEFLRKYIRDAYWMNGTEYRNIQQYSWMNGLEKVKFEEIIISSFLGTRYEKGFVTPRYLWKNEEYIKLMVESGIIKKYLSKKYEDGRSVLLKYFFKNKNFNAIEKYFDKGYYQITAKDIHENHWAFYREDDFSEKERKMGHGGTLLDTYYLSGEKEYKFKYHLTDINRKHLKYIFSRCVSTKEEILWSILSIDDTYRSEIYGSVTVYYEYFHDFNRKDAEFVAEKNYGYYLWARYGKFKKNDNFAPDEDLITVMMKHSLSLDKYRIDITEKINTDFKPFFEGKETELEVYFYWATNGQTKWAKIHEVLDKLNLKQGICWNYTYQQLLTIASDTITKINKNKDELKKIELERKRLDKQEKELIKGAI